MSDWAVGFQGPGHVPTPYIPRNGLLVAEWNQLDVSSTPGAWKPGGQASWGLERRGVGIYSRRG